MKLGYKRDITEDDLYHVIQEDESENLGRKLEMFVNITIFVFYLYCATIFYQLSMSIPLNQRMG